MSTEGKSRPEVDALVIQNREYVRALALKIKRTVSPVVEVEELEAYGLRGLVEAAQRYDGRQGVAFSTFSYYRIRGAMFDGLRSMGWYSRAEYARYRAEERANDYLQSAAARDGAATAAGASGGTGSVTQGQAVHELASLLGGLATIHMASLEAAAEVADPKAVAQDVALHGGRMSARLRAAVAGLPEKERRLLELYYFEDKSLEEAGGALGLSKSWASRLHARAVELLRDALGDDEA